MDLESSKKGELLLEAYEDSWEDPAVGTQGGAAFWGVASATGAGAGSEAPDEAEEACESWQDGVSWEDAAGAEEGGPVSSQRIAASPDVPAEASSGAGGIPVGSADKGKGPERPLDGAESAGKELELQLQGLTFEEESTVAYKVAAAVLSGSVAVIDAQHGGVGRPVGAYDEMSKQPGVAAGTPAALEQEIKVSCGSAAVTACDMARVESWVCAICHESIRLAETAQIKGCEHPYCANCILQWCSYKQYPWCPQCRQPFDSLCLFKLLDGSLSDAMIEESVCLLLRAPWFLPVEVPDEVDGEEELGGDEEDEYDEDEYYRSTLRIGNRRWGENGYVRGGRIQARVSIPQVPGAGSSSGTPSSGGRRGSAAKPPAQNGSQGMGRRAKRAQKREQEDEETGGASRSTRQQPRERQQRAQAERQARTGQVS